MDDNMCRDKEYQRLKKILKSINKACSHVQDISNALCGSAETQEMHNTLVGLYIEYSEKLNKRVDLLECGYIVTCNNGDTIYF